MCLPKAFEPDQLNAEVDGKQGSQGKGSGEGKSLFWEISGVLLVIDGVHSNEALVGCKEIKGDTWCFASSWMVDSQEERQGF